MLDQWSDFLAQQGATYDDSGQLLQFSTPFDNAFAYSQHLCVLNLIGDDAHKFMQGQLSCDIEEVRKGAARLTAHLSLQGRVQVSFWVLPHPSEENGYCLLMPRSMVEALQTLWQKYLMFSRSKLTVFEEAVVLSAPTEPAQALCAALALDSEAEFGQQDNWQHFQQHGHYYFLTTIEQLTNIWPTLTEIGSIGGMLQAQFWDIHNGVAHIYPGGENKALPQAMNYDLIQGISFNKGCYTGQEVVARMKFRGQLRQRLHHLSWPEDTDTTPGLTLRNAEGRAVGHLVNAIREGGSTHALAVIRRDMDLPSAIEDTEIHTHLQSLPYALPEIGQ
ncbi:MAG TPA: hypothetical protein VK099_07690 [Alcanivoracaceae bacterium]|nr:hypothetical protein [Alcanivoracaceae bacterium]